MPSTPRHAGHDSGGPRQRDAVYDAGADWTWLLGTVALACYLAAGPSLLTCSLSPGGALRHTVPSRAPR